MNPHGQFEYTPPPPPRTDSIAVNTPPAPRFDLVWRLPPAAAHRLQPCSDAPCSELVALWSCPVCSKSIPRWRGPGRHRVYCTNSCKQRAYRHRCRQRQSVPMSTRRDPRPMRATTRDRVHAVREFGDVLSGRRDSIHRGITTCGAFARIALDTPSKFSHLRFVGRDEPRGNTCLRCMQLSGATPSTAEVEWQSAA